MKWFDALTYSIPHNMVESTEYGVATDATHQNVAAAVMKKKYDEMT
jgi:hypothetical protein